MRKINLSSLDGEFLLVIPTYRILEALQTAKRYAENFIFFGHEIPILIFDDGDKMPSSKEFSILEKMNYKPGIFYVGGEEKDLFINNLEIKNKKLISQIFRPSYGGNRNFTLAFTVGKKIITVDDDMYPYSFFNKERELLAKNELAKGKFYGKNSLQYKKLPEDIARAFKEVLGKKAQEVSCRSGFCVLDTAMDLYSNTSTGKLDDNNLILIPGKVKDDAVVKIAQTFRTGSPDIDTVDYIEEFFRDPKLISMNDLSKVYVLSNYVPCITEENWRIDSGVSALDNTLGLPPFIPTDLRYEDYIFRIWAQHPKVVSAHVNAVQTHKRSPNRPSLAKNFLSEELTALMKRELRRLTREIHETSVSFTGGLFIFERDILEMFEKGRQLFEKSLSKTKLRKLSPYFYGFAEDLKNEFENFKYSAFNTKIRQKLDQEFNLLKKTMKVWPQIVKASPLMPKYAVVLSQRTENENLADIYTLPASQPAFKIRRN